MFAFFARIFARNAPRRDELQTAEVKAPVRARMAGVVRRFQGTFECGCAAHPLDEPHECPVHGSPRFYVEETEPIEINNVEVTAVM